MAAPGRRQVVFSSTTLVTMTFQHNVGATVFGEVFGVQFKRCKIGRLNHRAVVVEKEGTGNHVSFIFQIRPSPHERFRRSRWLRRFDHRGRIIGYLRRCLVGGACSGTTRQNQTGEHQ